MQGVNLLDAAALERRKAIFGECFTHSAVDLDRPAANLRWRWMIEGEWKLLVPQPTNEPDAAVELYHVSVDPREEHNLATDQPDRVAPHAGDARPLVESGGRGALVRWRAILC